MDKDLGGLMQYWWVIVTIASSMLAGYLSYKANVSKQTSWAIYLWALNILPIWAIVARYSKRILFDGILYDTLLVITYTSTVLFLTNKSAPLNTIQTISVIIIVLSLIVFKLAE